MTNILAFMCILMLYLGLAGMLGTILRLTSQTGRILRFSFFAFVMLPFSFGLPWSWVFKVVAWLMASVVVIAFYFQPMNRISLLWMEKFGLIYFSLLMALILAWSLLAPQVNGLILSLTACLALALCFVKLFRKKTI